MTLENERRQLIERIDHLQADEKERCDHQIRAKMHESLKPNVRCGPRRSRAGPEIRLITALVMTGFRFCADFASASLHQQLETAGFRRRGRDAFVVNLLWRSLVRRQLPACSHAEENLDSPQQDDNGRYQRGHSQYTL
jgi:hypothetical protein